MAGNNGGPWGGGGGNRGDDDDKAKRPNGGRRPGEGPQIPEIDELMNKGREQLRVLMGGGNRGGSNSSGPNEPFKVTRGMVGLGVLGLALLWAFMSFYTVRPEERSVELLLGARYQTGNPGLNFAPWPFVTYEVINVTSENSESIGGTGTANDGSGLMLTTDANIVDIGFQVVWNINDPEKVLFNISDPELTVRAVSESVMREIIAASNLAPILNRDRGLIADTVMANVQTTLDEYDSGITIVRVNLERADPPGEVIESFLKVQAAEQQRDTLQRQADAYANTVLGEARGTAASIVEAAEGYRAQTINDALGQASRFTAVLSEYLKAPEVTRQRIYLETMERVLSHVGKIILDPAVGGEGGSGVVPFLPLNELMRNTTAAPALGAATTAEGN